MSAAEWGELGIMIGKPKAPKALDAITDVVLAYKPPAKAKATKRREKRRAKRDAKKG
jgi:hypothetical protein